MLKQDARFCRRSTDILQVEPLHTVQCSITFSWCHY